MAFNVGPNNLKKFSKFISHINTNKYAMAADEMRNSLWYKQVGNRAKDLESIVRGSV
jgi:lysozyme